MYLAPSPRRKLFSLLYVFASLPPYLLTSLLRLSNTLPAFRLRLHPLRQKFREESALTAFGLRTRAFRPYQRSIRELHHPGTLVPQRMLFNRNDLGDFIYGRANKQTARPVRLTNCPYWLLSSCLTYLPLHAQEGPARNCSR